jgi:hypothetical protein
MPDTADKKRPRHWTEKLRDFDRRWVFLAMALAIILPRLFPLNLPTKASPMVKAAFYSVEALEEGDTVLLSLDLDPASTPELEPFYRAVVLQLKRKNVKLVILTTWYAAPPLIERWLRETIDQAIIQPGDGADPTYKGEPDRPYRSGVDYVWLGFREGREATINGLATDLRGTFDNVAADGTPMDKIGILDGINTLSDFDLVVMVSAGFPGIKEYVQQAQARGGVKMMGACTAVSTTDYTPYYNTGQLLGLVGGMAKAAEYEALVGKIGTATRGTDILNFGHAVVILAILFGNFIYFAGRRRRGVVG